MKEKFGFRFFSFVLAVAMCLMPFGGIAMADGETNVDAQIRIARWDASNEKPGDVLAASDTLEQDEQFVVELFFSKEIEVSAINITFVATNLEKINYSHHLS